VNINNEKMERLLREAGLPVDMKKIIGAKVLLNYASDVVEIGFHLFSQITGVMIPYDRAAGYSYLRVTLSTQKVFSGAKIVCLEFRQDNRWSLTIEEGTPDKLRCRSLLVPVFQLLDV